MSTERNNSIKAETVAAHCLGLLFRATAPPDRKKQTHIWIPYFQGLSSGSMQQLMRLIALLLVLLGATCAWALSNERSRGVVVEREEVCVVGREEVKARYCAKLSLKDIGTGEGFLRHLSWLRFENRIVQLPGDVSGPLGTRMVLSIKNHKEGLKDLNDSSSSLVDAISVDLSRVELLLKEVIGGAAIGWGPGPLDPEDDTFARARDVREIKSPFKTMVVLQEADGFGAEVNDLLSASHLFDDFSVRNSDSNEKSNSLIGLWHWLPGVSSNGLEKRDSWPSFFGFSGTPVADVKVENRGPFLTKWLEQQAHLWAPELSSQWQVHQRSLMLVSPYDKHKRLALTYCESARTNWPPKCTSASYMKQEPTATTSDAPPRPQLHVKNSTDLLECKTSRTGGDASERLWALQGAERLLVGNGAHRVLRTVVLLARPSQMVGTKSEVCILRMLERLPTGVFADQFELQGLKRHGAVKEALIYGDINLEQPALQSAQSIVDVHVSLHQSKANGSDGPALLLQAEVAIPLHARYPPVSVASHGVVQIPLPHMFLSCQQEGIVLPIAEEAGSKWKPVVMGNATASNTPVLEWLVPAGNPADLGFVARFTAIAALTGVLVVFAASVSADRPK